jgi:hypothetical protein
MTTGRLLPMLEIAPPPATEARASASADDSRLGEFRPESRALPSFYVWTLGCQMNRSDSEEMAGRLMAAGCAEAATMDSADLVVINTCAIREAAEAKVIGRQGELARLKSLNPSMRVVMTGCAVREMDRERLDRRFPAVDLFLRPDQEPELVDRLGLASAQGPVGLTGATTVVGRAVVGVADHLSGTRASAVAGGSVRRHSSVSAWLPIIYGCDKTCTYCIVPFSRGPERSRPFDEIVDEARAIGAQGFREVTLLGTLRRRRDSATSAPIAGRGDGWTSGAARTWRSSSARSTGCARPTGARRSPASASSRRTRGTSRTG